MFVNVRQRFLRHALYLGPNARRIHPCRLGLGGELGGDSVPARELGNLRAKSVEEATVGDADSQILDRVPSVIVCRVRRRGDPVDLLCRRDTVATG